jgi:hypothetical protein
MKHAPRLASLQQPGGVNLLTYGRIWWRDGTGRFAAAVVVHVATFQAASAWVRGFRFCLTLWL